MKLAAALLTLLVIAGCDLDYGKDQAVAADQVPQMVFSELRQTAIKDGQVLYTMEAQQSEVYQVRKEIRLKSFQFQEYDSEGEPASKGSADNAVINTDTNDARLSGRLTARSEEQAVTLEVTGGTAGGLSWTNETKILKTEPPSSVTLKKDDGSQIVAQSMTLDMGSNSLVLEGSVGGTWTTEATQDATTPSPPPSASEPLPPPP